MSFSFIANFGQCGRVVRALALRSENPGSRPALTTR